MVGGFSWGFFGFGFAISLLCVCKCQFWWRWTMPFGHSPQVLRRGGEQELIVCTARSAQSQAPQVQDALEVCKQHLHFLTIFARLLV